MLGAVAALPNTQVQGVSPLDGVTLKPGCVGSSPWHPGSKGVPPGKRKFPWTLFVVGAPPKKQVLGVSPWSGEDPLDLSMVAAPPDIQVQGVFPHRGVKVPWILGVVTARPSNQF